MKRLLLCIFLTVALSPALATAARTIQLGFAPRPGTTQQIAASTFKDLLEKRSSGAFTVTITEENDQSHDSLLLDRIQTGALHLGLINASAFEAQAPITRVISFPFLFTDDTQAEEILNGPLGSAILRDLETIGCKGLAFTENGFRHLTNNLRPVRQIGDLSGLRIRTLSTPLSIATWRALGANPASLPWPIFSELEQGILDGQENPLWVVETYSFHEVQQYLTLTRHSYSAHIGVASLKWWATLTGEEQKMISQAVVEAARFQRQGHRAKEAVRLLMLKGKGMVAEELPDRPGFRSQVAGLIALEAYSEPKVQALLGKMQEEAARPPQPTDHPPAQETPLPSTSDSVQTLTTDQADFAKPPDAAATPQLELQRSADLDASNRTEITDTVDGPPHRPSSSDSNSTVDHPLPPETDEDISIEQPPLPEKNARDSLKEQTHPLQPQESSQITNDADPPAEPPSSPVPAVLPPARIEHPSSTGLTPVIEERIPEASLNASPSPESPSTPPAPATPQEDKVPSWPDEIPPPNKIQPQIGQ